MIEPTPTELTATPGPPVMLQWKAAPGAGGWLSVRVDGKEAVRVLADVTRCSVPPGSGDWGTYSVVPVSDHGDEGIPITVAVHRRAEMTGPGQFPHHTATRRPLPPGSTR